MSRLVVIVPLREGTLEKARSLLAQGPPFDLEATDFDRHEVYLTDHEVVFVYEDKMFRVGSVISLAAFMLCVAILIKSRKRDTPLDGTRVKVGEA